MLTSLVLLLSASAHAWFPYQSILNQVTRRFDSTQAFLAYVNETFSTVGRSVESASWDYETNLTDANQAALTEKELAWNKIMEEITAEAAKYQGSTEDEKRQLTLLTSSLDSPKDPKILEELTQVLQDMESLYATATWKGQALEPDLTDVLATSRDYQVLEDAYIGWRNVTGPHMKDAYARFVELTNQGARDRGYRDAGDLWRSGYDMPADAFAAMVEDVWNQVQPLYEQLHCYIKGRLAEVYGEEHFGDDGLIPAHLLGNMWSQDFANIYELVLPYPDTLPIHINVNSSMTAEFMHRFSESFYLSLGYDPLPDNFWTKSMLVKPKDRDAVCHASAWDLGYNDLRIKMCTVPTEESLLTIYHEQGHLYYDHSYRDQPALYRDGAADFFHEAIGDSMQLSVMTPAYLQQVGLLKGKWDNTPEQVVNYQMAVALSKIAILPWAYLVDIWRWDVFEGKIGPDRYQEHWLDLVEEFQGFKRPVASTENDFDPGAKYHVAANVPYMRYFGAAVIQFQFHEALCAAAKQEGPLHECTIYNNKEAGKQFKAMLSLGRSQPWPEAIKTVTNNAHDSLDGRALMAYFEPLMTWLQQANAGKTCRWTKTKRASL